MAKYFGTDGIRGTSETLTPLLAFKTGLAVATLFGDTVVARDTRLSGEELEDGFVCGVTAGGGNVVRIGVAPTPAVSFALRRLNFKCGAMISASHNPPEFNGIKLIGGEGIKLSSVAEGAIENYIDARPMLTGGGKVKKDDSLLDMYVDSLVSRGIDLGGREIWLDCAFGAAYKIAPEVFARLNAKVIAVSNQNNGARINDGVGAVYPHYLASFCDGLGFAFDGDADRLAVIEGGEVVDGDSILYSLSRLRTCKVVVGTVMSNSALSITLGAEGKKLVRTPVGDKFIGELMLKRGYELGGEQSGHYIVRPSLTGDGIAAAVELTKSEICRLKLIPQSSISLPASSAVLFAPRVQRLLGEWCERLAGKGRVLMRMSGTEPKVRIMVEAEENALVSEAIEQFTQEVQLFNREDI